MASRGRSDGSQFAAIMDTDDVLVLQARGQVRLTIETLAKFQILGQIAGQDFQGIAAGQRRMLGQIHVTHPAGPQPSNDRVSRRPVRRCCQRFATCEHATEAATGSDRIIAWLTSEPDEIGG
jgi:hypothetical protein